MAVCVVFTALCPHPTEVLMKSRRILVCSAATLFVLAAIVSAYGGMACRFCPHNV
jgi:hypothetical protein